MTETEEQPQTETEAPNPEQPDENTAPPSNPEPDTARLEIEEEDADRTIATYALVAIGSSVGCHARLERLRG